MAALTLAEFRQFVAEALDQLAIDSAEAEPTDSVQTLADWWAVFSLVVVPDLLLQMEAPQASRLPEDRLAAAPLRPQAV